VDEAERLLEMRKASQDATNEDNDNREQECDREIGRDEAEPCDEVIVGRRRPDSVVVDWANKVLFVLEFKRTSDQRRDYKEGITRNPISVSRRLAPPRVGGGEKESALAVPPLSE
jgi:hypothetical protein